MLNEQNDERAVTRRYMSLEVIRARHPDRLRNRLEVESRLAISS